METIKVNLEFFVVINSDNKFLRSKGYSGYGDSWVDDIKKAKVYGRIGPARAQVTWWSNNFPNFATPKILKIIATDGVILDETERMKKIKDDKIKSKLNADKARKERDFIEAKRKLEEATINYNKFKNK